MDCDFQDFVSAPPAVSAQADSQDPAGLEAPSAKRLKTQFRCSKCGFITAKSAEFQQHIPQHKRDKNTPQCLHCGLCFTSVFSLSRHLFIVHKVKDPEEDGEERGTQEEGDVGAKERGSQPVTSADAEEINDFEENPHCSQTTDSPLKLNTRSQTEAAALQQ